MDILYYCVAALKSKHRNRNDKMKERKNADAVGFFFYNATVIASNFIALANYQHIHTREFYRRCDLAFLFLSKCLDFLCVYVFFFCSIKNISLGIFVWFRSFNNSHIISKTHTGKCLFLCVSCHFYNSGIQIKIAYKTWLTNHTNSITLMCW